MRNAHKLTYALPAIFFILTAPLHAETTGTFESAGVQIHYVDSEGEGAPVVLIHGFAGSSDAWTNNGLIGMGDYRTIAIDARGHGQSDKPHGPEFYGTAMADDVLALLDELDIEAAHIVGYSMGAEIALKFTVAHPERVLSLTVGGSGWSGTPEAEFYGFVGMSLADNASFADWIRAMDPTMTDEIFGYMVAALEANGIRQEGQVTRALADVALAMAGLIDLTAEEIAAIGVPVLGITGELDAERPNIEAMNGVVPDFTLVVIEGADHLDAPLTPQFREAIEAFLAAQR